MKNDWQTIGNDNNTKIAFVNHGQSIGRRLVNDLQMSVYKITNRGLVGIACQWLPVSTNNLPIDNYCTIMFLTKFLPIIIGTNW